MKTPPRSIRLPPQGDLRRNPDTFLGGQRLVNRVRVSAKPQPILDIPNDVDFRCRK